MRAAEPGGLSSPGGRFATRLVGQRIVVVDTTTGMLRVLNDSASALWLLIEGEARPYDRIVGDYAALFGLARSTAEVDVSCCLDVWRTYGWLDTHDASKVAFAPAPSPMVLPFVARAEYRTDDTPLPDHDVVWSRVCRLRAATFRVTLGASRQTASDDILPRVAAFLGGFPEVDEEADAEAVLILGRSEIVVRWPGAVVATADGSAGIAHLVLAIYGLAYPEESIVATLHAAALAGPSGTLLMPGRSGNGKSTLAAHLAGRGWRYMGDDSVALGAMGDECRATVLPFPSAVGLKPASWPVLSPRYPQIDALPTVAYADKLARFLTLTTMPLPDREACVPRAIVFPRYEAGHPGSLDAVDAAESMVAVAEAGLRTGERFDSGRIDRVLAFLEATPAYRMCFSDLAWAERALARL